MRLAILFLLAFCTVCAQASTARAQGSTLVVNEMSVLTIRTSYGKSTPEQRAKALAANLNGKESVSLGIQHDKTLSRIWSGDTVLIVVDRAEAKRHGTSTVALSTTWAKSLRKALDLPPVQLSKASLLLPPGKTGAVTLLGSEARTAEITIQNPEIVSVVRAGNKATVGGRAVGDTTVSIGDQTLSVRVLPYAANFPQTLTVTVVGAPAASATITGAIEGALKGRLQMVPDATASWRPVKAGDLPTGEKRSYQVKVSADSPNAFKSEGIVTLNVVNSPLALKRESELWYCNEPENIRKPQSLFLAHLESDEPVRMLYHHINQFGQGLFFRVMATNTSTVPAKVVIIPGDSKDPNPVLAGIMAADPFFRSWLTGSGEVVTVPPGGSLPIAFRRLAPLDTSSGLCYLRLLPGGPDHMVVTAEAVLPYAINDRWQRAQRTQTPWREVGVVADMSPAYASEHSSLIFPKPFKDESFTYVTGGNFGFFRIGQKPIAREEEGAPLDGNFGVIYHIQANAENPTDVPTEVELVFEASAGYSGALFAIDGTIMRLPLMQAKSEARLARFRLNPGESKTMSVTTIPLSGSSYPATLVLRPISNLPDLDYGRR